MIEPPSAGAAAAEQPLARRTVLIAGPDSRLTYDVARAARDRGAVVALATTRPCAEGAAGDVAWFEFANDSEVNADRLFDDVAARFERLDIVIIAVASVPLGVLHQLPVDGWRTAVTQPLRSVFWLARRAIEECLAAGSGTRLVLLLDPAAGGPRNEVLEEALCSFARSVAREYGRRALSCNVVLPVVDAPAAQGSEQSLSDATVEHVLFLASPAASFVNGEALFVELDTAHPNFRHGGARNEESRRSAR